MRAPVQLLVYRFAAGTSFEGQVVGALERLQLGGAVRLLDAVVVARDATSGEVVGLGVHGGLGADSLARLLTFRLDADERRRATRALPEEVREALASTLPVGSAVMAMLIGHEWARPLEDAVGRVGGTALPSTFVEATSLADLAPALRDLAVGFPG
jgi:hypothetical protein